MSKELARRSPALSGELAAYRHHPLFEGRATYPLYQNVLPQITVIWPDKQPLRQAARHESRLNIKRIILAAGIFASNILSPADNPQKTPLLIPSIQPMTDPALAKLNTELIEDTLIIPPSAMVVTQPQSTSNTLAPAETSRDEGARIPPVESEENKKTIQDQKIKTALEPLPTPPGTDTELWKEVAFYSGELFPKYKIPISLILAQFKVEQGGKDPPFNNLVGITGVGPDGSFGGFKKYHTIKECVEDYFGIVSNYSSIKPLVKEGSLSPERYILAIKVAGYATDVNYTTKLRGIYQQFHLEDYDKALQNLLEVVP